MKQRLLFFVDVFIITLLIIPCALVKAEEIPVYDNVEIINYDDLDVHYNEYVYVPNECIETWESRMNWSYSINGYYDDYALPIMYLSSGNLSTSSSAYYFDSYNPLDTNFIYINDSYRYFNEVEALEFGKVYVLHGSFNAGIYLIYRCNIESNTSIFNNPFSNAIYFNAPIYHEFKNENEVSGSSLDLIAYDFSEDTYYNMYICWGLNSSTSLPEEFVFWMNSNEAALNASQNDNSASDISSEITEAPQVTNSVVETITNSPIEATPTKAENTATVTVTQSAKSDIDGPSSNFPVVPVVIAAVCCMAIIIFIVLKRKN